MKNSGQSLFRTVIGMMISPGTAIKSAASGIPWFFSVSLSALAFGLFFVQTALDLYKTGQKGLGFVVYSSLAGILYGALIIPLLGTLVWLILKLFKTKKDCKWAISTFCLSYSGALIYGVLGLAFSLLFSWKTSVAFGITGVLWAIGPMMLTVRTMTGGKNKVSILISTCVSIIVLLSWSIFGII